MAVERPGNGAGAGGCRRREAAANDGERKRQKAERAAPALVRAHVAVRGGLKSFGRKIIDTIRPIFILLKLLAMVLDENRAVVLDENRC
jgi:hypothetical protein